MAASLKHPSVLGGLVLALVYAVSGPALAHGVAGADQQFLEVSTGQQLGPFLYLGAKHMVTGYDHLLFLVGVLFFLYRPRDVAVYVTLFSLGHSLTLLYGVLSGTHVDPYLVDAVIGFSVVYKGLDNLGLLERWLGFQPSTKGAVLLFGLVHGFGLATKLQDFSLSQDGLVANILAFNAGVEIGQLLALGLVLIGLGYWRRSAAFGRQAAGANVLLIVAGLGLVVYQLNGFFRAGAGA